MRILVVTGSSGGHIYPAVAFLEVLLKRSGQDELLLVVPRKHAPINIDQGRIRVRHIAVSSFSRRAWKFISACFGLFWGTLESLYLLITYRPKLVVGFGSLNSVPVILSAKLFGIKTLIHEQNVLPGRANRLLSRFADRVAVSFNASGPYLKKAGEKIVLTGNPLRSEISAVEKKQALDFFGFEAGVPVVMVIGGSQGSTNINRAFEAACSGFKDKFRVQVIHLCGSSMSEELNRYYCAQGIRAKVFSFLSQMRYAYSAADLAVSRAGALALSELAHFGLPAVIIPYPFAHQHQMYNAREFASCARAMVVEDHGLAAGKLKEAMEYFLADQTRLGPLPSAYTERFLPDASERLADEAIKLTGS